MRGYDSATIDRLAGVLYRATASDDAVSWSRFKHHAERDATAAELLGHWHGLAIAALDLTHGARARIAAR